MPKKRGAVVIGVNKTGDLPKLEASAAGAKKFAEWLTGEGFTVTTITDEKDPVTAADIKKAVKAFVDPGTYDQLVVYFTGHGYWKNDSELWLLTGSPLDANEAVNWTETVEFAKDSGISNVVLISDACRSVPETPQALRVRGSIVFPNDGVKRERAKVDRFMAAAVGASAYELPLVAGGEKENVFTHCLLRAFEAPDAEMVMSVEEDGKTIDIVPNRKLGKYLKRAVSTLLASVSIAIEQTPDDEVTSDEKAYIGRAKAVGPASAQETGDISFASARRRPGRKIAPVPDDPREIASKAFVEALDAPLGKIWVDREHTHHRRFDDALNKAGSLVSQNVCFSTGTGFAVLGVRLQEIMVAGGTAELLNEGDGVGVPAQVQVQPFLRGATVVVMFENGSGAALAALTGYIGHVVVNDGKVVSINYVPSEQSDRSLLLAQDGGQLLRLRAAAAAAIRFGAFRVDDPDAARRLADLIRAEKGIDPSLGLYAAYAYSTSDYRDELDSVAAYMRQDIGVDLFDVAMLARRTIAADRSQPTSLSVVPFCPMLTQGWNLLRARGIELPAVLDAAQDDLHHAVWTTFRPEPLRKIFDAIQNGKLR